MNAKHIILLSLVLLLSPYTLKAQQWDMVGVEAFIDDHKGERSLMITRSVVEQGNKILHKTSDNTNAKYRDMGKSLDSYTKAFDAIDVIINALSTGFQIYRTYENVSDKVSSYKDMLEDFNDKIIKRGRIEPADTMLISINKAAIEEIYGECKNIYSSVTALAAYSSGQLLAKTSDINLQIRQIDISLRRISDIINRAYFQTYSFIKSRIYMWNRAIWTEKSKNTIANEAFARWRDRGRNTKVTSKTK